MKYNVYINDKLYKTVTSTSENYSPMSLWPQIEEDKKSGLLSTYNITEKLKIVVEKVPS